MTKKINKMSHKEQDNIPVSHEEFDRAIKALLNSPPRKIRKGKK
ncbi:hypothetical protein [endosymbiont GvMRE of Glomus versiforme]|nr:hypothetical protein [endosymbiont GvMRE of Glomus versiforme]RHZ36179.1 hypothetical protein GvMRE_Ic2g79 [endosymbiont GvMRE of Glomus versiforme]